MIKELIFEAYHILDKNCDSDCENCKYSKDIKGSDGDMVCDAVTSLVLKYEQKEFNV